MKKIYISFLLLLSICCISPTLAQSVAPAPYYSMTNWDTSPYKSFRFTSQRSSYEWINFRMLYPNGYDSLATDNKKYPLIIMLHGAGESGRMQWDNTAKKNTPYPEGDPRIDNNDHQLLYGAREHLTAVQNGRFPGFVIFPQNFYGSWVSGNGSASSSLHKDLLKVTEMIDYLITELKIDPARIYVHGLSNGAAGTWYAAYNRPDLFAAALPMSAPGDPAMAEKLKTVPLWVFQGELDTNPRPFSTLLTVDAVRNAGGTVRYLEYAGTGHNTWNKAYREADFFEWMLSQRKGGGEVPNQPPVVDAGTDKAITLPTNTASFTATASDSDGTIASWLWEKVSGPAATLSGTSTATLSLSNLIEGSYTFKVTITDNEGASALDEVNLTVMPASGTSCQALAFDGSNKLSLSAPIVLSGDFTVEYWAKFSTGITNADAPLSGGSNQFINYYNAQARIYSNGASGGNDPIVSSHKTQAGAWTHYAFVRQGSSMKVYINGVEDTGAKTTGQWTGDFTINNLGQGAGNLAGELDEVRLWNLARSSNDIAASYNTNISASASNLVAYYTFEEQSGVVVDKSGNSYDSQSLPAGITRLSSTAPLSCEGEGEPEPNQPPVVDAGTDKAITLPTNTASFTATASDPDGSVSSYLWEKVSGPAATLSGTSTATLSLSNLVEGSYTFKVTITDNEGASALDEVNLTVMPASGTSCQALAFDGSNKLSLSAPIVLSGDFTVEYWAKFSTGITNADAPLSGGSNQFINYYNAQARIYSKGATGGQDPVVSSHKTQAGAWTHYAFVRQGSSMKVYINGVEDTGAKTTGQWTGDFTINNLGQGYNGFFNGEIDELRLWNEARSGTAIAENFEKGVAVSSSALTAYYTFEEQSGVVVDRTSNGFDSQSLPAGISRTSSTAPLTDCEGEGEPAPNQPPVANAGTDKAITLPTNTTSFTATASDPDGTIASWLWEKVSGPAATLSGSTTATVSLSGLTEGTYTFKVTVTDNEGATAADQVNLTVNAATAGNQLPVVDAGSDKAITLPENSTSFTATASDPDGSVGSYLWEKVSGPAATLSGTSTATLSLSNLVEGSYTFKVTVTDNEGATATDEVNLAVNPGSDGNQVPVANAGSDKTLTLPTNAISLSGTAYDSDGRFVAFKWEKVSGPSVTMSGQNTANVKLSALVEGVYVFRFSATDNGGATGSDEMTLTVKPAEETVQSSTSAARVSNSSTSTVNAYPNTFTNHLNIALSAEEPNLYHIKMVDLSGKTVYTSSLQTAMTEAAVYQGVHRIELEKAPLQQGMYILLVEAQDGSFKKVMKVFRGR